MSHRVRGWILWAALIPGTLLAEVQITPTPQYLEPLGHSLAVARGGAIEIVAGPTGAAISPKMRLAADFLRQALVRAAGSIEVGHIHYSPRLQRSTATTEAMFLMMRQAFESGYRRYEWKCDALNTASRAAAQRLGLSFEGVFRQATVYKGRNRDTAWYAAVDAEWPALREAFLAWLDPANFDADGRQRTRLSDRTRPLLKRLG